MFSALPLALLSLLSATGFESASPHQLSRRSVGQATLLLLSFSQHASLASASSLHRRANKLQTDTNGSSFIWTIQDTYEGKTFFDTFDFFTGEDPTHGMVNYTDRATALANNLVYVTEDDKVIMKGDNTTSLASGVYRNSVRISSQAQYNTGEPSIRINIACDVLDMPTGEIDIIEGVHDNAHNQVTWHTGPNCYLDTNVSFTGTPVSSGTNITCDGNANGNAGCGVTEWSRASYGPIFDQQGGGVFAMKWDDQGIAVWSFYRAAVPADVLAGSPTPSTWGEPVALLDPSSCDPITNFVNHSIVFGDWAGNSYATSGCPGTCTDRLMDPSNFVNASWNINTLKVYRKQTLTGLVNGAESEVCARVLCKVTWLALALPILVLVVL
uniref:Mixed-linked glucanase n=1 Tax=Ganoderma boninense TaxID=34458 RepID=A0A5K1JY34_9APHY|nr:Mixed-linked glucanase [Ganoderma boninense]